MEQDIDTATLRNDLISFCIRHHPLYLYGAGRVGHTYLRVFRRLGFEPDGFLITQGEKSTIDRIPVVPVNEFSMPFDKNIGIIGAFKDVTIPLIRDHVGENPDILLLPHPSIYFLVYDMALFSQLRMIHQSRPLTEMTAWKNILVIRLDVLGDLVMTTPFLRELRRNCPDSHITLVVRRSNGLLFKNCPYISELVLYDCMYGEEPTVFDEFEKNEPYRELHQRVRAFAEERLCCDRHYDIAFQPCGLLAGRNSAEALFLSLYSGADVQVGRAAQYGERNAFAMFMRSKWPEVMSLVSYDIEPRHEVLCMLDMLRRAGGTVLDETAELWLTERDRESVRAEFPDFFVSGRAWIAVGLVGSEPRKNWPPERYREAIERLCGAYGSRLGFVLLGGPDAAENAARVMRGLPAESGAVMDLTGRTNLAQLQAVIEHCVLYLGADTGLKHVAAACGNPVVEISTTISDSKGLRFGLSEIMGAWQVECIVLRAPRGLDDCECNCSKTYPHCITLITVDAVVNATKEMLERIGVEPEHGN